MVGWIWIRHWFFHDANFMVIRSESHVFTFCETIEDIENMNTYWRFFIKSMHLLIKEKNRYRVIGHGIQTGEMAKENHNFDKVFFCFFLKMCTNVLETNWTKRFNGEPEYKVNFRTKCIVLLCLFIYPLGTSLFISFPLALLAFFLIPTVVLVHFPFLPSCLFTPHPSCLFTFPHPSCLFISLPLQAFSFPFLPSCLFISLPPDMHVYFPSYWHACLFPSHLLCLFIPLSSSLFFSPFIT